MIYYRRSEQHNDIIFKCNETKKKFKFCSIFLLQQVHETGSRRSNLFCYYFVSTKFTYFHTTIFLNVVETAVFDRAKLTRCSQKSELARVN